MLSPGTLERGGIQRFELESQILFSATITVTLSYICKVFTYFRPLDIRILDDWVSMLKSLVINCCILICRCMLAKHNDTIRTSDTVF